MTVSEARRGNNGCVGAKISIRVVAKEQYSRYRFIIPNQFSRQDQADTSLIMNVRTIGKRACKYFVVCQEKCEDNKVVGWQAIRKTAAAAASTKRSGFGRRDDDYARVRSPALSSNHGREKKKVKMMIRHDKFIAKRCLCSANKSRARSRARQRRVVLLRLSLETVLIRRATNSLSLFVAIENNLTLILNELAIIVTLPKSVERITIIVSVVLANERLEVLGSFFTVIEGHLREEVMDNVIVCDVVEEETTLPSEERTVDRARCTTLETPFTLAVVRKALVGVMKLNIKDPI